MVRPFGEEAVLLEHVYYLFAGGCQQFSNAPLPLGTVHAAIFSNTCRPWRRGYVGRLLRLLGLQSHDGLAALQLNSAHDVHGHGVGKRGAIC